jgi:hypothetical protein
VAPSRLPILGDIITLGEVAAVLVAVDMLNGDISFLFDLMGFI